MWKKRKTCVFMNVGMDAWLNKNSDRGDSKNQLRTDICIVKQGPN